MGRLRMLPGGRPQAFYQVADVDAEKLVRGTALLAELLFAAGARRILPPWEGAPELRSADDVRKLYRQPVDKRQLEVLTVHIMGTARMGGDRARAVTDSHGLVYDADRLMVADASLFPTPIGVNPMETIQALVTRNVHHVLSNPKRHLS